MQTGKSLSLLEKLFPPSPYHKENLPEKFQTLAAFDACVFVPWAPEAILNNGGFHRNFLDKVPQRLEQETSASIICWVRDTNIKSITLQERPLKQTRHARNTKQKITVLIRIRQQDKTAAQTLLADLQAFGYQTAVYVVRNTVPLEYKRTWPNGVQSPGLVSVFFF